MYIDNLPMIIPACNEATRIPNTIARIHNFLIRCCEHSEITVSNIDGIKDTQRRIKALRADVSGEIFGKCRITGFIFDVAILFTSRLKEFRMKEVPIKWAHLQSSEIRSFKDSVIIFSMYSKYGSTTCAARIKSGVSCKPS